MKIIKILFFALIGFWVLTFVACPPDNTIDPSPPAQAIHFIDTNPSLNMITGNIKITKAADETFVSAYNVYFGSDRSTKLVSAMLGTVQSGTARLDISLANCPIIPGAKYLLVYTVNKDAVPLENTDPSDITAVELFDLVVERVTDINTSGPSNPNSLCEFNSKLYFSATQNSSLYTLMSYDEGESQATLIGSIQTPSHLFEFNNRLYMQATGTNGAELWYCDTSDVVRDVADINTGTGSSNPSYMMVFSDSTDGYAKKIFFQADNGTHGTELFSCDTTHTVTRLTDINTAGNSDPQYMIAFKGKLYFAATNTSGESRLYSYTHTGGAVAVDIVNNSPQYLTEYNEKLYFQSNVAATNVGSEIWFYDPILVQHNFVTDINPSGNSDPRELITFDNKLFFAATASDGTNYQLWQYDGSAIDDIMVNFNGNSDPKNFHIYNERLYFQGNAGSGNEVVVYDPYYGETVQIDLNPAGSSNPGNFTTHNSKLYFSADAGDTYGNELYRLYYVLQ